MCRRISVSLTFLLPMIETPSTGPRRSAAASALSGGTGNAGPGATVSGEVRVGGGTGSGRVSPGDWPRIAGQPPCARPASGAAEPSRHRLTTPRQRSTSPTVRRESERLRDGLSQPCVTPSHLDGRARCMQSESAHHREELVRVYARLCFLARQRRQDAVTWHDRASLTLLDTVAHRRPANAADGWAA